MLACCFLSYFNELLSLDSVNNSNLKLNYPIFRGCKCNHENYISKLLAKNIKLFFIFEK